MSKLENENTINKAADWRLHKPNIFTRARLHLVPLKLS